VPKLTDRGISALKLKEGQKDRLVFDSACPGLGVRITARGGRIFIAQWTDPATKRKVREPLGAWGNITIDQARDAVRARLGAVAKGIDVRGERERLKHEDQQRRKVDALTFERLVANWENLHLGQRRERYREEAVRAIRFAFADLLKQPAARITRDDVRERLDRVARTKPAMAGRTLAYGRAAYRWTQKRGEVAENPFRTCRR